MSTGTADFASYRFSTRELPERLRIPMWRERFCRGIVHADIEPSSDGPFQAEATLQATRGLRTIALKGSAMCFKRSQASIVDGDDSIGIIVCSNSRSQLSQRGREIELGAGDAISILHSEPVTVTYLEGLQFGLAVPCDALAPTRLRTIVSTAFSDAPPNANFRIKLSVSTTRSDRSIPLESPPDVAMEPASTKRAPRTSRMSGNFIAKSV